MNRSRFALDVATFNEMLKAISAASSNAALALLVSAYFKPVIEDRLPQGQPVLILVAVSIFVSGVTILALMQPDERH